jgi:hypothetical protein
VIKAVAGISPAQVRRYLREAELQPHRSRYWLNTTEKDPVLFQAQVVMVCARYQDAPQLFHHHDTYTLSVGQMKGIQALERVADTMPILSCQQKLREFEYKRHGTLTLIGNLHVVTGVMVTLTLGPTRTGTDFVRHIAQTIRLEPNRRQAT